MFIVFLIKAINILSLYHNKEFGLMSKNYSSFEGHWQCIEDPEKDPSLFRTRAPFE